MDVTEYRDTQPRLDLFEYFEGSTKAWGMFSDRGGKVLRRFTVSIQGVVQQDFLTLTEDFVYDDGELQQRIWQIERLEDGRYRGFADDVIGEARGVASGSALNWAYTLALPFRGSVYQVKFDDWMFLQTDGVLLNRAQVSKFGFRLGEVTLAFKKEGS